MHRIQSLDLARGFTMLFIPAIHTVLLYSKPEVYTSWLGYPLQFMAEWPDAQLFMLIMSLLFTLKKQHNPFNIFTRSIGLLLVGYLLNIAKFVIPYSVGQLPSAVLHDLQINPNENILWQLTAIGDILHFAAIALLIVYAVYQLKYYFIWALLLAMFIIVGGPALYDSKSSNTTINYLLQLTSGQPPRVFFPLLPWLAYPLIGLSLGYFWQRSINTAIKLMLLAASLVIITAFCVFDITAEHTTAGFYRTMPGTTLLHLGFTLLWLLTWHWLSQKFIRPKFFDLLIFCSGNITTIYIIQWILICWLLPLVGYQVLNTWQSLVMAIITSGITFSFTYFISYKKHIK